MDESILTSIKKFIGIPEDYKVFDPDLILLINSEFSTLHQVGVGTSSAFRIEDESSVWSDFSGDKDYIESVKELIGIRVKMIFDPPANSFVMEALKSKADELTWRLNVADDPAVHEAYPENYVTN